VNAVTNSTTTECPQCKSTEIGLGKQGGHANVHPANKLSIGTEVEHKVCTNCGLLIESYVKNPQKFKNTL